MTFPRLAGEDLLVVDPSANPSLRFTPGGLPGRVLSISRGGVTYAVLSACDGGPDEYIPLAPASTGISQACSLNSDTNGIRFMPLSPVGNEVTQILAQP